LAINFYGLRELTEVGLREGGAVVNIASIAGYARIDIDADDVGAQRLERR
jgi:hypothetical protein